MALIGGNEAYAPEMLDAIKAELEANDLLLEDFPEAVYPIRGLEGIANRVAGHTYLPADTAYGGAENPQSTYIRRTAKEIVLPTIAGSDTYGASTQGAALPGMRPVLPPRRRKRYTQENLLRRHVKLVRRQGMDEPMDKQTVKEEQRGLECRACGCRHFQVTYTYATDCRMKFLPAFGTEQ